MSNKVIINQNLGKSNTFPTNFSQFSNGLNIKKLQTDFRSKLILFLRIVHKLFAYKMASWGTVCRNSGKGGKIHVVIHCLKFINTIRKCSLHILYYEILHHCSWHIRVY